MPDPDDTLRTFLADRDEPCPGCAYNLRALTGSRCPECNQELVIRVGLAEPRLAWFVCGVIGIAMGLGFCSLVFAWAMTVWISRGGMGGPRGSELLPLVVGTLVGAVLMLVWVRRRRRLGGSSRERRWGEAAIVSAIALISPFWFFSIVR